MICPRCGKRMNPGQLLVRYSHKVRVLFAPTEVVGREGFVEIPSRQSPRFETAAR